MTDKYDDATNRLTVLSEQILTIREQLNDKWEILKGNPFDLNNLFTLLGKTTMAVSFLLEEKYSETQHSLTTLQQIQEMETKYDNTDTTAS